MDLRTFAENHKRRLLDDYVNVLRNKVHDLSRIIWRDNGVDVFADQHSGNVKPFCYSRVWGPLTYQSASLTQYILPSYPSPSSIVVGREGAFWWDEVNCAVFSSWPMSPVDTVNVPAVGFIFDSAFKQNGGAIPDPLMGLSVKANDHRQHPIGFDMVLYDKKRGRALHDDRLPREFFDGGRVTNKSLAEPIRFDPNSELEPRLYLNSPLEDETGVITLDDGIHTVKTTRYIWINIMFKGHIALED